MKWIDLIETTIPGAEFSCLSAEENRDFARRLKSADGPTEQQKLVRMLYGMMALNLNGLISIAERSDPAQVLTRLIGTWVPEDLRELKNAAIARVLSLAGAEEIDDDDNDFPR